MDKGMKELEETIIRALLYFSETKSHLKGFSSRVTSAFERATKTIGPKPQERPQPQERPKPKALHQLNLPLLHVLDQPGLITMTDTSQSILPPPSLSPPHLSTALAQPVASTSSACHLPLRGTPLLYLACLEGDYLGMSLPPHLHPPPREACWGKVAFRVILFVRWLHHCCFGGISFTSKST